MRREIFAFSKATKEYIYSADADEVLSEENRRRFRLLKETLLPEIEIVQMKYGNQLQNGTVYNFDEEYRPKLFRRLRSFVWEEPIHETVRLEPVVYDSDIVITHMPEQNHAGRDLTNFRKQIAQGRRLSRRLYGMYARELFLAGEARDFLEAEDYFRAEVSSPDRSADEITEGCCVVARAAQTAGSCCRHFSSILSKVIAGDRAVRKSAVNWGISMKRRETLRKRLSGIIMQLMKHSRYWRCGVRKKNLYRG